MFLNQLDEFKSYDNWLDVELKLNWFGFDLNVLPIRYGKTGALYFEKVPDPSIEFGFIVAKYA